MKGIDFLVYFRAFYSFSLEVLTVKFGQRYNDLDLTIKAVVKNINVYASWCWFVPHIFSSPLTFNNLIHKRYVSKK